MLKIYSIALVLLHYATFPGTATNPCIGQYEVYALCKNPCPPTCKTLYTQNPIPTCVRPKPCPSGCDCSPGYYRNDKNICVLKEQCPIPQCTGANQIFEPNSTLCLETCRSYQRLVPKPGCIPTPPYPDGCKCIPGFVRNDNNVCIRPADCPPPITCTNPNEVPNFCPRPCTPSITTCAQHLSNTPSVCPNPGVINPLCVPRCDCAPGYLRNSRNQCVRSQDCCEGANEILVDCPDPCPLTCDNLDTRNNTVCNLRCAVRGCTCRPGYVRNSAGVCILRETCPPKCKDTEVINNCPNSCQIDETCSTILANVTLLCRPLPNPTCVPRCFCRPGLVRIGTNCVSPNQCCNGVNSEEAVDCPTGCDNTCEGTAATTCQLTCPKKICKCRTGYVRNVRGECILSNSCPRCTDPNEEYKFCGTACESTCDNLQNSCPTRPCVDGCFCKSGYVRHNRRCIPILECPLKCNENEVYNPCAAACTFDETCSTLAGETLPPCTPPRNATCIRRCECIQGFVRVGDRCVSQNQCCTNPTVEETVPCPVPCDDTCEGPAPTGCNRQTNCRRGCRCISGYVRNITRQCVPINTCPRCTGANEVYRFCSCDSNCDNPSIVCTGCAEGCFCAPGYVRYNRQCIRPAQCPPRCVENEVLNLCPSPCATENTCDTLLNPSGPNTCVPPSTFECRPRCECAAGYVRRNRICIPIDQCCSVPAAEQVVNCSAPCDLNCEGNRQTNCQCTNMRCGCRPGFVRNSAGICIPIATCPRCTGVNEVYRMCGSACPATCDNLNPTCTQRCVDGCFCLPGFVRFNGECIDPETCPIPCGTNEVFNRCPGWCTFDVDCPALLDGIVRDCAPPPPVQVCVRRCDCAPGFVRVGRNCVSPDQCCSDPATEESAPCPLPCDATCAGPAPANCTIRRCARRGCRCRSGLVRDANNRCIPPTSCPPRCTNPNEEFRTCGTACQPTCSNRNPTCTLQCVAGCFCRPGFIRNNDNVCIPERLCPPICGNNEVLVECPQFCTFDESCDTLMGGLIIDCFERPIDFQCVPTCYCRPGYVRIRNACVPSNQCCPNPDTQIVVNCTAPCHNDCTGRPDPSCVRQICLRNKCRCRLDYVNNTRGVCAPVSTCPPPCTRPNEEYRVCGTRCQPTCANRNPTCTRDCAEGCFCREGYIRSVEGGECIRIPDCPLICTGANEEFKSCGSCDPTCNNLRPTCATTECVRGCFCKPGFVRNANGVCIEERSCPPRCTGANEEFLVCGSACPPTCSDRIRTCPLICVPGCYCRAGFIRNNGVCIRVEDCPINCTDPNEEFTLCGTCDKTCVAPNLVCRIACQRGCFCKTGFVRENGKCIRPIDCPKTCPANEVFNSCGTACQPTCQNLNATCYLPCVSGCFCKPGMVRKGDICVNRADCACPVNEVQTDCCPKIQASCANRVATSNTVCKPCCVCQDGYIRSGTKCIKTTACP